MNSFVDGGSSRVSIPNHLRKTLQSIREITGKQHSDDDIFAVYKDSFNDPHETAQKLLFLDTFHEVKSKRDKKKENVVPVTQGSVRTARRNTASSSTYQDAGNGRNASFKRENGTNHLSGGSRTSRPATSKAGNLTVSRPMNLVSGVSNGKAQDDFTATVNKVHAENNPVSNSTSASEDGVVPQTSKPVATPESVSVVQNHIQDVTSTQIPEPVVNNQPVELQSTFGQQDPPLISASRCSSQSDQVTVNETASNTGKNESLFKLGGGERSHVTFPLHLQVAEVLQNGLTFGSFDSNFVKEVYSNGARSSDDSVSESSHRTGGDEGDSSPTTNGIHGNASAREEASSLIEDKSNGTSITEHIIPSVNDEVKEETLLNTQTHQIAYGQEVPLSVFGFVPPLSAFGQPVNTEAAETQHGNSNAPAITYPLDQRSIAAASQQAAHLFRQQYPPSFFPYGPYYPPFYMPPPYMHQFLCQNGVPQQPYFPTGAALAAPTHITPAGDTENPPTTNPSPHAPTTVASNIPSANTLNSVHSEEKASPVTESAAAWMGQGLGNLQMGPMYNLAMQGQPLGFPVGHGGLMGIHQPTQPMASASTTYQTLPPPPPNTVTTMAEPIGHPHIAYQQHQPRPTSWVNN